VNTLIARYFQSMPSLRQAWPIPLRLIVGYGFMEHGYAKLARGPESFTSILHALNVPEPSFMAWATILIELFGGFAVLVGAFIPLASVPMAMVLLVAIFTVHLPNGFSSIKLESVTSATALTSDSLDTRHPSCIWWHLLPWFWEDRAPWPSIASSSAARPQRDRRWHLDPCGAARKQLLAHAGKTLLLLQLAQLPPSQKNAAVGLASIAELL